jgi:hypothetical protein
LAESNEPNPFSFSTDTCIYLNIEAACSPVIDVYNLAGKIIGKIFYENLPIGEQRICFDFSNYPSGVYFFRSTGCKDTATKKIWIMHIEESDKAKKKEDSFDLCPNDGINYYLTEQSDVLLSLSDNLGRPLDILISETQPAGQYAYFWDNTRWPSGSYKIAIEVNEQMRAYYIFYSDKTERNLISSSVNKPNTISSSSAIDYNLDSSCHVCLIIYNVCGEMIDTFINEIKESGRHKEYWRGEGHSSGVYFCKGTICDSSFIRKFLLVK